MANLIVKPFAPMERALRDLIRRDLTEVAGSPRAVGRDLPDSKLNGLYIRLERVAGSAGRIEGDFVFDVETFHPNYSKAESAASALGALLLAYPHTLLLDDRRVTFDSVTENQGPSEIPWDDDNVHRLLATYVITARR